MRGSLMHWIAPSEKDTNNAALEKRLWDAADTATRVSAKPESESTWRDFRRAKDHWSANSGLKSQEYSAPVLGLIFLRFAEVRFAAKRAQLESPSPLGGDLSCLGSNEGICQRQRPVAGRASGRERVTGPG